MDEEKTSNGGFLQLEWVRRSVAEHITELGNTQIFVESAYVKLKEEFVKIEQTENRLLKDCDNEWGSLHSIQSISTSPRSMSAHAMHSITSLPKSQTLPTTDDNIYLCLYLAKLYADFARFIEADTILPTKSENHWSGKNAIFKPLFNMAVDIARCYLRIGHISYQSRFSKSSRLRMPRFDPTKCSADETDTLRRLLHQYSRPYEEKYPVEQSSQSSICTNSTASSLESVSSNPTNPSHVVPIYFKVFIHDNREVFWKYMSPGTRYLIAEDSSHHPPGKLIRMAMRMILEDVIDTLYPKRQEARMHDYVLDDIQMKLSDMPGVLLPEAGKIAMQYGQGQHKAVLSHCVYHIKTRLSALQFKFRNQCYCEKAFHHYIISFNE